MTLSFTDAILRAHGENLSENARALVLGLGVNYSNGADGTTKGLAARFPKQVFDTPVSELSFTGMAVGLGSQGFRPIVHHGRVEFAMLAFDQIFTQASRWNYMFGGDYPCSVGFRICIGRQWGNGPQHTANYHSMFLQSLGLDILIPSSPRDAYRHVRFMNSSECPAIMLEHRWLYKTLETVDNTPTDGLPPIASLYGEGKEGLIISYGDGVVEALRAMDLLQTFGREFAVLALKYFPDKNRIPKKLMTTISSYPEIVFVDTAPFAFGILSSLAGSILASNGKAYKVSVFGPESRPCPTSPALAGDYYPTAPKIVGDLLLSNSTGRRPDLQQYTFDQLHLPPAFNFDERQHADVFLN